MAEKEFVDMDIFSRRIGPYFTWLESKIESGWKQSDSCKKNVLRETKEMAQSMRARFILGITRNDFEEEVDRAMELFNLALDAFPDYSGEVEQKLQHFTKGLKTEFGDTIIKNGFAVENSIVEEEPKVEAPAPKMKKKAPVKKAKPKVKKESKPVKKAVKPAKKRSSKKAKKTVKKGEMAEPVKVKDGQEEVDVREQVKDRRPQVKPKKDKVVVGWLRRFIYGED